jgi:LPS export ABC transporter permease LptF/LPS export ABC transporter permease LptG
MRLLSRNTLREIAPPFFLGLAAYTFILVLRSLLTLSEMVIRRGLGPLTVAELLFLTLPQVLVLTIPMAFLFGVLIGVGRLSGDSEIIAMRSGGVSLWGLARPVFGLALVLSAAVGYLAFWGYPRANDRLEGLENQLFASAALDLIRPRVFSSPAADRDFVLFVDRETQRGQGWDGVFLADRSNPSEEQVVVAREGQFRSDARGLWLDLSEATSHFFAPGHPDVYRVSRNRRQSILLHESAAASPGTTTSVKSLRMQTLPQLFRSLRGEPGSSPARRRLVRVEIHKKFAIPLACLVFALVGVPLGVTNRRGGKGSGFAISIAIILGYYLLFNTGESWSESGRIAPAVAMWLPNVLLALLGAALFLRRDQERRTLLDRFSEWRRARRYRREAAAPPAAPVRRSPWAGLGRFPAALDLYVSRPFLAALAAIYTTVVFLYVIVDYSDHAEDIARRAIPPDVVWGYYRALLVPILVQILPFCILLAALIALGSLSRDNEDTAFRACGVPLPRLGVSILALALAASAGSYVCGEYLLPAANRRSNQLLDRIKGRSPSSRGDSPAAGAIWILGGEGHRIWSFDSYEAATGRIWRPSVFELDDSFELVRRIGAASATWNGRAWVFEDGWLRTFQGETERSFVQFARSPLVEGDPPRLFSQERQRPDEMRYRALSRYVRRLKETGYPAAPLETALASKPATASQPFVLALVAIPFAFTIGKRGALTGIGVGLASGMLFLVLAAFFRKMGEVGSLPPLLAAWSPDLIFLLLGSYRLARLRT